MTKRIVSGIFALAALGALGVIIGGALASGEQLIVRFLTAVIVAALALYVVSDLRLESDPELARENVVRPDPRPAESTSHSFAMSPDSTVPTISMSSDGRDLQPAARTIDTGHPPADLQPATRADAVAWSASADTSNLATAATGPKAIYDLTDDIDTDNLPRIASNGIASNADPDSSFDEPNTSDIEFAPWMPSVAADGDDIEDAEQDAVYVTVGTHEYQGNLETAASGWPKKAAEGDSLFAEPGYTQFDQSQRVPSLETRPLVELATMTADRLTPEPFQASDTVPAEAGLETDHEAGGSSEPEELASDFEHEAASEQDDESTSTLDLARTTAAYAGATRTPVIDLREPTTKDVPATADVVDASTPKAVAQKEDRVAVAIADGEQKIIDALLRQGMLSTTGPITNRDVRTMVYVAFTSNELRKLILVGGQHGPEGDQLGTVELFDETLFQPIPQTLYEGRPTESPNLPTPADAGLIAKASVDGHQSNVI